MTYPNLQVATLLNENFIPVQVDIEKVSKLANEFQAIWTPNLNVLDRNQKRVYWVEGWLAPSEFAAMLDVARGHFFLRGKKYTQAEPIFKEVFEQHPLSQFAPEALYYRGVSRYLNSHEVDELKEDWIMLQRFYPQSTWSLRSNIL
ncbi:MAG: hypothetical protein PVI93_23235 [Desulfobacterales bacterium]